LASAPDFSSISTSAALPFVHASDSGVTPYRLAALTFAPGADQELRDLEIVVIGRPVERCHAIGLWCVDVDALFDQRANLRAVHLFCRVSQRRARRRRVGGGGEDKQNRCRRLGAV
jgi:hypothetical protein